MGDKEPDIKVLMPLEKYLSILVDSYPEPIRSSELAKKTGHSKAAISKIRSRLLQLCDTKLMRLEKGFVLSQNFSMFPSFFIVFLTHGNHQKFLSSRFFKSIINGKLIHAKIAPLFPLYAQKFTEDDTSFLINKAVEMLENLPSEDFRFLSRLISSKKPASLLTLNTLNEIQSITKNLRFTFNNAEEVVKTVYLRDKFFFLIREILWAMIENMEILKKQDEKSRELYRFVYKDTIDFYLRHVFQQFDESLLAAGKQFLGKDAESKVRIGASQIMQ